MCAINKNSGGLGFMENGGREGVFYRTSSKVLDFNKLRYYVMEHLYY